MDLSIGFRAFKFDLRLSLEFVLSVPVNTPQRDLALPLFKVLHD